MEPAAPAPAPAPSLELKNPHSLVIHWLPGPPQPRVCMKTKRLALLNDCKDYLLIQMLTLLYYSVPAFPLLQGEVLGGGGSDRTEEMRRGGEEERRRGEEMRRGKEGEEKGKEGKGGEKDQPH